MNLLLPWPLRVFRASIAALGLVITASFSMALAQTETVVAEQNAAAPTQKELELAEERVFRLATSLIAPSIVRIETVGGLDEVDGILAVNGSTTGVIVGSDGWIVTSAFNFISKPTSILITLPDGRKFPARLTATDTLRMLALLKIDASELPTPIIAPPDSVQVGAWALALGRSLSPDQPSVSIGVISAKERVWGKAIQTDAKVSPVNYGGPLIDLEGRMTGLLVPLSPQSQTVSAGFEWYDSGIGFAIPAADVMHALPRMQAGENLRPGLMGISFAGNDLSGDAPVVERVRFQSPASAAGILVNDVIVGADDIPIARLGNLKHVLGRKYAGDQLRLKILRKNEPLEVTIPLVAEIPPWDEATAGFLLKRNSLSTNAESEPEKLIVRAVFPNSPAMSGGLLAGDEILAIDGESVATADSLRKLLDRRKPGDQPRFTLRRQNQNGQPEEVQVSITLKGQPFPVPGELPAVANEKPLGEGENVPKAKGRFLEKLAVNGREYWGYAPASATGQQPHGLIVWLHPSGNSMEAAVLKSLKVECDRRQIMLVGPKAEGKGWTPEDVDFVKALVEHLQSEYPIDPGRIVVMGQTDSTKLASFLVFKDPAIYRGAILVGGPTAGQPPERDPAARLHLNLTIPEGSRSADGLKKLVESLKKQKSAISTIFVSGDGSEFPDGTWAEQIGIWIDQIDRF